MHDTPSPSLERRLRLARLALLWERLWPAAVPALSLLAVFAALGLFDVLPLLPGWLHGLVLAAFAAGAGFLAWRAVSIVRPGDDEAARRLERDSGMAHRPLAALGDRLAAGADDAMAKALWQLHLHRMAELADRLRVGWPSPGMPARDPWGYRFAALLLLVIALAGGTADLHGRLARAMTPAIGPGGPPPLLEVWLTPPAYTGVAPVALKPGTTQEMAVPAGSTVLAVLAGGWGSARLTVDGHAIPFQREGDETQRLETRLDAGRRLGIEQGWRTVAQWPIQVVRDALPSITFAGPIEAGERGRLAIPAEASDDYGLDKAWVTARRVDAVDDETLTIELPLPAGRPHAARLDGWHDLTAHPWAGLPVTMTPSAADALGQVGSGEAVTVTLPERHFSQPVARALVERRRLVTEDPWNGPPVSRFLAALLSEPESYGGDKTVALALEVARRVLLDPESLDLTEVQDLLWSAALRIEDGDLASAERALEDSRRELDQALADGASAEEVQHLLDTFQAAVERYLDALAEQLARSGAPPPQGGELLSDQELSQMMEGMRGLAETGNREALRQMLGDLRQMLESLQAASPRQPGAGDEALRQLGEVSRRQREMLDEAFRKSRPDTPPSLDGDEDGATPAPAPQAKPGGDGSRAAATQEQLRRALGEIGRTLGQAMGGKAPPSLDEAGQAMAGAAGSLSRNAWGSAAEQQGEALRLMREGAREAMQAMEAQGRGSGRLGLVPRDPFGRPMRGGAGFGDDHTTRLPSGGDIQRARQILDELRRRSGEWQRPAEEKEYLKRLLRQY
jgi:uncharacterized protein (TIGR02302 family)